jgi:hypothetical protein
LPKLDSTTVLDDGEVDTLHRNKKLDCFFAGPGDKLPDKRSAEQLN